MGCLPFGCELYRKPLMSEIVPLHALVIKGSGSLNQRFSHILRLCGKAIDGNSNFQQCRGLNLLSQLLDLKSSKCGAWWQLSFQSSLSFWDLPKIIRKEPCRQNLFIAKLHYVCCQGYCSGDLVASPSLFLLDYHRPAQEEAGEQRSQSLVIRTSAVVSWWPTVRNGVLPTFPLLLSSGVWTCKEPRPHRNTLFSSLNISPARLNPSSFVKPLWQCSSLPLFYLYSSLFCFLITYCLVTLPLFFLI